MITKGLWRAKFEKDKIVEVIKTSKKYVWFRNETFRIRYSAIQFLIDFMQAEIEKEE